MTTTLPILVAYDGSADSERALRWATAESLRTRFPLRVLAVNAVIPPTWGAVGGVGMIGVYDVALSDSTAVLAQAEKVIAEAGVEDASVEQRSGHVVDELLRASESAAMLVVGSRGHGPAAVAVLGSVSQHLARHATCPVVVVREPRDPDASRIIVGIDGSWSSIAALEYACERAEETGETVVALHAWHVRAPSTDVWNSEARVLETGDREVLLAESVAGVVVDHPDVRLEKEVVAVAPAQALVDASEGASLVVVGSRGLGFFSGLLLGSISQTVLQRAQCPVAVVR
jgi:nucleotide-binding universal stress UspA family protein